MKFFTISSISSFCKFCFRYIHSDFTIEKNDSIGILSTQLPLLDMLCCILFSFNSFTYCQFVKCQPWSECKIKFFLWLNDTFFNACLTVSNTSFKSMKLEILYATIDLHTNL